MLAYLVRGLAVSLYPRANVSAILGHLRIKCAAGCATALLALSVAGWSQTFDESFQSPPTDARVMMRWWWFGPAVAKAELLREMQQMKAGGIGGFEIQPVYPLALDDPQTGFRNLPYLSREFLEDVRYANDEAAKLGLRVSLTLSSGWPYGGPHTPVTEAAGAIHLETTQTAKGESSVALPALATGDSLIAVFMEDSDPNGAVAGSPHLKMLPLPAAGITRMALPPTEDNESRKILWFLSSRTGQQVKRPAVDADGFVLDHFSQQAVEDHLHTVADPLMSAFTERPPYSVFSDSLEVYGSDWTPELPAEFSKRRGYDLRPHLPELFTAHPSAEAQAVRRDWGLTLTELINQNYLKTVNGWAAAHHTLFRSQTYGAPAVSLSSNALVDLPEGEGPQWRQFSYTRWATSAAHVYGRPIVSSETWTWLHSPAFRATPLDMKAEADRFFLQGINQFMGHGWAYSPSSVAEPGWRFYAAGVFNAHNPWWLVMPDVMGYMQRTSWALRQGQPDNDIAVYLPEDDAYAAFTPGKVSLSELLQHWITPALTQAIEDSGYNFDYIDSEAIAARGIRYPVLVLPQVDRMSARTLQAIAAYCQHGGKVIAIGRIPEHAPGLLGLGKESVVVESSAKRLFSDVGNSIAILVPDVEHLGAASQQAQAPDMQLTGSATAVGFIHRKLEHADLYFLANTGNTPVHATVKFRSRYTAGEWLDADTGKTRPLGAADPVALDLAPYESRLLLLDKDSRAGTQNTMMPSRQTVEDLNSGWQLRFESTGYTERMPSLASWTAQAQTRFYSGVATYRRSLQLPANGQKPMRYFVSFGQGNPTASDSAKDHPGMHAELDAPLRDAAVIYVNGQRAGSLWHPPYEVEVTALVKPGRNDLEVRLANTAINEMAGQSQPDYRLLWARYGERFTPQDMDHLAPLPSGLLGPVKLIEESAQ